jgi:hypothetical protein
VESAPELPLRASGIQRKVALVSSLIFASYSGLSLQSPRVSLHQLRAPRSSAGKHPKAPPGWLTKTKSSIDTL